MPESVFFCLALMKALVDSGLLSPVDKISLKYLVIPNRFWICSKLTSLFSEVEGHNDNGHGKVDLAPGIFQHLNNQGIPHNVQPTPHYRHQQGQVQRGNGGPLSNKVVRLNNSMCTPWGDSHAALWKRTPQQELFKSADALVVEQQIVPATLTEGSFT